MRILGILALTSALFCIHCKSESKPIYTDNQELTIDSTVDTEYKEIEDLESEIDSLHEDIDSILQLLEEF